MGDAKNKSNGVNYDAEIRWAANQKFNYLEGDVAYYKEKYGDKWEDHYNWGFEMTKFANNPEAIKASKATPIDPVTGNPIATFPAYIHPPERGEHSAVEQNPKVTKPERINISKSARNLINDLTEPDFNKTKYPGVSTLEYLNDKDLRKIKESPINVAPEEIPIIKQQAKIDGRTPEQRTFKPTVAVDPAKIEEIQNLGDANDFAKYRSSQIDAMEQRNEHISQPTAQSTSSTHTQIQPTAINQPTKEKTMQTLTAQPNTIQEVSPAVSATTQKKASSLNDLLNPSYSPAPDVMPETQTQFTPEQSKQAKFFKEYKGWSDDQIHSYFNPKPEMTALDIFTQTKKEPEAPDPKKLQNNERVAAIAQGVGTLADIFSGVMGARVQKNNNPSPYAIVKGKNDELKKTYEQKMENYNQGKQAAMLQDVIYKQGKDAQTRAVAEGQYYQQQQQDAAEAKADARYNERSAQQLENYKAQVDYQTDAINNRSNYRNSNKGTSGKTTTDKYTPEQVVEINKELKRIPEDFLIQNGAPTKEVTIEEGKPPFQTKRKVRVVDYDAVKPEIMNEYIRRYSGQQTQNTSTEQTNTTKPRTNQPTAGVMPGSKKIPGF